MINKGIVFYVNSLKFFISHRMNLVRLANNNNYNVIICCKVDTDIPNEKFKSYQIIDINFRGSEFNIFNESKNIFKIRKLIKINKNYIHHFITIKPIFYASLLRNQLNSSKVVISFSGIGYIASNQSLRAKILKNIFNYFSKKLFNLKNINIIFQNIDDYKFIHSSTKFKKDKSIIIPGSGIDLQQIKYSKIPNNENTTFLLAARLLKDKGIIEFINASQEILLNNKKVRFIIIGDIDKNNPSYVDKKIINDWQDNKNKFFKNYQRNIIEYIKNSDVIVLPSYREGLPKFLIEANAVGRPIITTNVPGCKECVIDGQNGYLFEPKNTSSLIQAMEKILIRKNHFDTMSRKSRLIAEKKFSIKKVNEEHLKIYKG